MYISELSHRIQEPTNAKACKRGELSDPVAQPNLAPADPIIEPPFEPLERIVDIIERLAIAAPELTGQLIAELTRADAWVLERLFAPGYISRHRFHPITIRRPTKNGRGSIRRLRSRAARRASRRCL